MTTHALVQYVVTDEEAYGRYRSLAGPSVKQYGGTFSLKGSVARTLEGAERRTNVTLIQFESHEGAVAWYESPEYQAAVAARSDAGDMDISIIESSPA